MKHLLLIFLILMATTSVFAQGEIKINQLGFYPESRKVAVIPGSSVGSFQIVEAGSDKIVYTNNLTEPRHWEYSDEYVSLADFSAFTIPGTYRVMYGPSMVSHPFEIKNEVHFELSRASIKAYYFNRASTALDEEYAGIWARPKGHPDDRAYIHASAATAERPEGTVISSPKGWYDAGDYNKYAVNSGISTYTILAAYEHYPQYYHNLDLDIPESGNGMPDILNEARWNLDWLLTIQDPYDGGVYHKLTSLNFAGIVMPHEDDADRYAVMKSTSGTLNFAAVMAAAARVYMDYDEDFATEALEAAKYAWQWASANPDMYYQQPGDVNTGAYGDRTLDDEFDWAAAELYITTQNDGFWNARVFNDPDITIRVPSWSYVRPLAWVSLAHHRDNLTDAADIELIEQRILDYGNELMEEYNVSAYNVSMGRYERDFVWGSNGVIGNHSLLLLQAYRLTGDEMYLDAAHANLDYILGRNATGYSFVTGFGSHSPMFPHHRQSAADENTDPVPGFVVGGPQPGQQDDCSYPSDLPAKSYIDDWCSYSTNEVAINWNAPLVYLTGAIEYFRNK